jgi:hypothetical protein
LPSHSLESTDRPPSAMIRRSRPRMLPCRLSFVPFVLGMVVYGCGEDTVNRCHRVHEERMRRLIAIWAHKADSTVHIPPPPRASDSLWAAENCTNGSPR